MVGAVHPRHRSRGAPVCQPLKTGRCKHQAVARSCDVRGDGEQIHFADAVPVRPRNAESGDANRVPSHHDTVRVEPLGGSHGVEAVDRHGCLLRMIDKRPIVDRHDRLDICLLHSCNRYTGGRHGHNVPHRSGHPDNAPRLDVPQAIARLDLPPTECPQRVPRTLGNKSHRSQDRPFLGR